MAPLRTPSGTRTHSCPNPAGLSMRGATSGLRASATQKLSDSPLPFDASVCGSAEQGRAHAYVLDRQPQLLQQLRHVLHLDAAHPAL